ncbi:MAG: glycosyltransferase family 4 protein [Candidatus Omnitrophota bacterium]
MKILLIHNFYRFRGGEDRYVSILQRILEQNGHRVITFFVDSRDIETFGMVKKCLIPFSLIYSPTASRKLEHLIREEKPDLAVVHNLFPLLSLSILNVLKRHHIPVLKRLENYKFLCLNGLFLTNDFKTCERCKYGNFFPGIIHRCYQRSFLNSLGIAVSEFIHRKLKTVLKTTDRFLASSEFVKTKFIQAGFPGANIIVHPNFIDFKPIPNVEPPGDYAVYLGRLSAEKGLMTLLNAFKELPDLPLRIVGDGPMRNELETVVREHRMTNVTFDGFIDGPEKQKILKKALVMVFPSECYESFGYTIVESFACGVPVIASDNGPASELVTEGHTGFLFRKENPADLREKMVLLLSDRTRLMEMKTNALVQARSLYTDEKGYQRLEQLFIRMVETKN